MRVLVVSAHPHDESFLGHLRTEVLNELRTGGHDIRHHDLYEEAFNPVFTSYERLNHVGNIATKLQELPELVPYVESLKWCEALVLVYPTWWSGQPAIMKGWIDRVFMNEVAWILPDGHTRIKPLLTNVRRLVIVTTHGSSKLINSLQGETGKRIALRSIRLMFYPRVRTRWIGVYRLDRSDERQRRQKTKRVMRQLSRAFR